MTISIGDAVARIDGRAKVTGAARYPGDLKIEGALHAAIVRSTVASGRLVAIDDARARLGAGVREIFTHGNFGKLEETGFLLLLQNDRIWHDGQPVALVVADTPEHARRAAALVKVEYEASFTPGALSPRTLAEESEGAFTPEHVQTNPPDSTRGDPRKGLEDAAIRIERRYTTPMQNHNPLEPHAAVAEWNEGTVTVHTTAQGVFVARDAIALGIGIPVERVRVVSTFVGGGFCAKGRAWLPLVLVVAEAARRLDAPVRLELRREEMFTMVGHRQPTRQTLALGASASGQLTAITHDVVARTSEFGVYADPNGFPSRVLYLCPNVSTSHRLIRANVPQPVAMRAPGEGTGTFALESAIDETAYELQMDPLEFRRRNFASFDQHVNKPWSSNGLRQCYRVASEAFGWAARPLATRSLRDGHLLRGWGMASAYYPVFQTDASATVSMLPDGTVVARCGTQDVGTGTYTVIAQIVAATLDIPIDRVRVEIGDTALPPGPPAFGSMSAASFTPAVIRAAEALRGLTANRTEHANTGCTIEASGSATPTERSTSHSTNAYGAVFVEVEVDEGLGQVRVSRVTAAYAAGRILNARTARSQFVGGLVFGIGMALHEETRFDENMGRVVNGTLADYLVPVHADIPDIDVHLVADPDEHLGNGGVKGIGMLGTVGTAAAIANAVFHATGRRIRNLPIRLEQFQG